MNPAPQPAPKTMLPIPFGWQYQYQAHAPIKQTIGTASGRALQLAPGASEPAKACNCTSMGHPEQCAEQAGCRWLAKLDRMTTAPA